MARWKEHGAGKFVVLGALAAVVTFASPAAAAESSTTTVQASPSSVTAGQAVELSAKVSCPTDPSGGLGVTFFDGGDILSTVPVTSSGDAAYTAHLSTVGSHTITAAYNGNTACNASSAETTVVVSAAPTPPRHPSAPCLLLCEIFSDLVEEGREAAREELGHRSAPTKGWPANDWIRMPQTPRT
ncbi:Ig-like domain-containing protein [Wenjunlia vitaminophila]|uniref:Ig-like domain-containing protein n=1 Tax=Wenjunlia vitaminophila TaxID=76728 RepID=UPI0003688D49|nr:Ig-like domain-containing protein [Wenjunlia vitaminophila]